MPQQWAVETLAAAMEPATIADRAQAQAWLQFKVPRAGLGAAPVTLKLH